MTAGGRQPSDITSQTSEVFALNPSTGQWGHVINIPAARSFPAVVSMYDKMIIIGGMTNKNTKHSNTVWIGNLRLLALMLSLIEAIGIRLFSVTKFYILLLFLLSCIL